HRLAPRRGRAVASRARGDRRGSPRRVLDAGCGNGDFAAVIAAPEVVCVDASEAAVEAARRQGLTAQVAALEHLPFGDGTFDLVTYNWVLYHLSDPEAMWETKGGSADVSRRVRRADRAAHGTRRPVPAEGDSPQLRPDRREVACAASEPATSVRA